MGYFYELINIYENQLNIPHNGKCSNCDAKYKKPLLPWQIGAKYYTEKGGVFIAGKPHRGDLKAETTKGIIVKASGVIDGRRLGERLFFKEKKWPYWSYTREVLNSIYGTSEESWEHITFTNIVKCSSTDAGDKTSRLCAKQCIIENNVIFKEIELLKPKKILFFTWSMHRDLLYEIPFAKEGTIIEHTSNDYRRKCGAKQLGWWDRTLIANWGSKVDFLVLGHPERMKKVEYVAMVSEWLKKP